MMQKFFARDIARFIVAIVLQVIVFQYIFKGTALSPYVFVFFYPIAILLLPIRTPPIVVILLSFGLGVFIDLYYGTIGIHTSALVFVGFIRQYLLRLMEPRKKYEIKDIPNIANFGVRWFLIYTSILLLANCFFYYAVDAFTLVYLLDILVKTVLSTVISTLFIFIYVILYRNA